MKKQYAPGYWVLYTDRTIKFTPFTYLRGTKKEARSIVKAFQKHKVELKISKPYLWMKLGIRKIDLVEQPLPVDIPDKLLEDIFRPVQLRKCR